MDGWFVLFNSISVISGRWKSEHEELCAMKPPDAKTSEQSLCSEFVSSATDWKKMSLPLLTGTLNLSQSFRG